jgi:general stress protein 26
MTSTNPPTRPAARPAEERKRDTLHRLEHDVDLWVATADADGGSPYLVPLSFHWDGAVVLIATVADGITGRNLRATGRVRLGIGPTRDVTLVEGTAELLPADELTDELGDTFAARTGFDPRKDPDMAFFRIRPQRIQAWREANELKGRLLMRDGRWLV